MVCLSCFLEESSEAVPGSGVTHGALGLVATYSVMIRAYCSQPDVKQRVIKCEMGEQRQSHGAAFSQSLTISSSFNCSSMQGS